MAQMIPSTPLPGTIGEERLYRLLEKLPDSYIAWQSPIIGGLEADFILYTPKNGLIVLEVKDWILPQIVSGNGKEVILRFNRKKEIRKSPFGQVQKYLNILKSIFSKKQGRLPFPLQMGAVLTNIDRQEYEQRLETDDGISGILNLEHTIFRDDLDFMEHTRSLGKNFQKFLDIYFLPQFHSKLSQKDQAEIAKKTLGSPIMPLEKVPSVWEDGERKLIKLDLELAHEALNIHTQKTLIYGAAGSGKTIILIARAAMLFRRGNAKKILFLCYNLTLVNYLQRIFSVLILPISKNGIEVMPIFDLIEQITGENVASKDSPDYYTTLTNIALMETSSSNHILKGVWDAIIVDEGQDYPEAMIQIVENLCTPETSLTIAADRSQRIYSDGSPSRWESIEDIKVIEIKKCHYRCSRQIMAFATDWLNGGKLAKADLGVTDGEIPLVLFADNAVQAAKMAADETEKWNTIGIHQKDLAILYITSANKEPMLITEALGDNALVSYWLSQDDRAKRSFDGTTDRVTISTIQSVKGLDFAHVTLMLPLSMSEGRAHDLLKSMDDYGIRKEMITEPSYMRRCIYVGMTRARQSLTIIWYNSGRHFNAITEQGE